MKAGRMRHCLRLERPDPGTLDAYGGEQENWTPVAEVDAAIDSLTGREYMAADRELGGITWRITLREIPGVQVEPGWRGVEVDGDAPRTFDFTAILPSHARDELTLAATSGQSQP
jgi:head-tail adaptor